MATDSLRQHGRERGIEFSNSNYDMVTNVVLIFHILLPTIGIKSVAIHQNV